MFPEELIWKPSRGRETVGSSFDNPQRLSSKIIAAIRMIMYSYLQNLLGSNARGVNAGISD